jgi:hypothetical protein
LIAIIIPEAKSVEQKHGTTEFRGCIKIYRYTYVVFSYRIFSEIFLAPGFRAPPGRRPCRQRDPQYTAANSAIKAANAVRIRWGYANGMGTPSMSIGGNAPKGGVYTSRTGQIALSCGASLHSSVELPRYAALLRPPSDLEIAHNLLPCAKKKCRMHLRDWHKGSAQSWHFEVAEVAVAYQSGLPPVASLIPMRTCVTYLLGLG